MSGIYIGVDDIARKVKGVYIGVDGVARKVKKCYVGDENGIARLCYIDNPYDPVFANNTWEQIADACRTRRVPDTWLVGDQKTMTIDGTDYLIDIIGKDHDDYADGSGKAPLTFQLHDCYNTTYSMNNEFTNEGGWGSSLMCVTHLPSILALMPSEVKGNIREVTKLTSQGGGLSGINIVVNKLFLLSEIEVYGSILSSYSGEGTQYEYYANGGEVVKTNNGSRKNQWMRSPMANESASFCTINTNGYRGVSGATGSLSIAFAFCF